MNEIITQELVTWRDGELAPFIQSIILSKSMRERKQTVAIMADWMEDHGYQNSNKLERFRTCTSVFHHGYSVEVISSLARPYWIDDLMNIHYVYTFPSLEWLTSERCEKLVRIWVAGKCYEVDTYRWATDIAIRKGWVYIMREDKPGKYRRMKWLK